MITSLGSISCLVVVSLLWGITNPFIKRGTQGLENVEASSRLRKFVNEIIFLIRNLKVCSSCIYKENARPWGTNFIEIFHTSRYIMPFAINQIGSLLYFLILSDTDISLAIPFTNSLTFVITAITGWMLGEEKVHRNTYIGMILILVGIVLCCWDKIDKTV